MTFTFTLKLRALSNHIHPNWYTKKTKSIASSNSTTDIHLFYRYASIFQTMAKRIKHRPSCSLHILKRLIYIYFFFSPIFGRTIAWKFYTLKSTFNLLYYFSLIDIKLLEVTQFFFCNCKTFFPLGLFDFLFFFFIFVFALPIFAIM